MIYLRSWHPHWQEIWLHNCAPICTPWITMDYPRAILVLVLHNLLQKAVFFLFVEKKCTIMWTPLCTTGQNCTQNSAQTILNIMHNILYQMLTNTFEKEVQATLLPSHSKIMMIMRKMTMIMRMTIVRVKGSLRLETDVSTSWWHTPILPPPRHDDDDEEEKEEE